MSIACCDCPNTIEESMGYTVAGDSVSAMNGGVPGKVIKVRCPFCAERLVQLLDRFAERNAVNAISVRTGNQN